MAASGGLDRIATLVKAVRGERGDDRVLLLDGGDAWQGSWSALQTKGQDMVDAMSALKLDAMTSHWEFTLGAERVKEIVDAAPFAFLAQNIRDKEWNEAIFPPRKLFEKGGVKVAVIGQALPRTAIANPRWMFPNGSSASARTNSRNRSMRRVRKAPRSSSCSRMTASTSTASWRGGSRASTSS